MKSILLVLSFICSISVAIGNIQADDKEAGREHLKKLLQERKDKFREYLDNLEERSGIFGQQTKKDIRNVNEVLIELIKLDNRIIKELDNIIDYKQFENITKEKSVVKKEELLEEHQQAVNRLNKRIDVLTRENKHLEHQRNQYQVYMGIAAFITLILLALSLLRWIRGR